jgi:sterol desaturase/sphingolipid hydroxylase (fatty acid hydroxylase superfamily)
MEFLTSLFAELQLWVFETLLQPLMFAVGLASRLDTGFDATGWLLVGLLQLLVMLLVFGPLQRWRPVESVDDSSAVVSDIVYTLIHRLGLFRLFLFFALDPLFDMVLGQLRASGIPTLHLDDLWPGLTDLAWVSFLIYLVVFDFLNYAIHRAQHSFNWWWSLHALHHSQRKMTMWTDNRNHFLDDILRDALLVVFAQLIGIAPGQFVAVVAFTQLCENFQHANVRVWFGAVGERLWISPRFHRVHHSIGVGHESYGRRTLGGHNFGVLLPWWDMLFGTADFELKYEPTGIRDQVEEGVDYGTGVWAQQRLGLQRLWRSAFGTAK